MEFRILGPLEVLEDGRTLALGGAKQRALLAMLLLNANRVVSSDRLIDALWDEEPTATAQKALQVYVSQLRKLIGRERLQTKARGYVLRVEPDELDLLRFERLGGEGQPKEALALWRGQALADFAEQRFAQNEIARLEELRLACLEERIEQDLEGARHAQLVPELELAVKEHPSRERLTQQLMLALYRSGRQADALEVYRRGRRMLIDELGLEPGRALQELEGAILRRDPRLDLDPPMPAESSAPADTITFLFTDIEGETSLLERLGDGYGEVRADHERLLRAAFAEFGGHEIDTEGDAFFVAFGRARDAVSAALAAERALSEHTWPDGAEIQVRMGIHTDEPSVASEGYHGLGARRAARICAAGNGGQILISDATRHLLGDDEQLAVTLRDCGEHRLTGRPEHIFQVVASGLRDDCPPLGAAEVTPLAVAGRKNALAGAARAALHRVPGRRSRMRAWVAAFATLLLVGSVTTALVETFAGGSAKSILGPNTLGVVDPRSDRVVAGIAVGDTPTAVAVGGGAVWVLNANEQTLSRIDPRSRKVLKTIPAGPAPSDIAVGAGAVWVASAGFTLTEIDPDSGSVLRTLKLPMTPRLLGRDANSAWVAARNDRVWAAGLGSVMRVAPPGPRLLLRTVRCCGGIAIGDGSVWVTDDAGLARLDAKTGAISAQIRLPFSASRLAVGAGAVWVVDPNGNAVWTIDPRLNQVTRTITVGSNPQGVAVGQGGVWIASADGTIARIDSATQRVVETVLVEGTPAGLAVGAGAVWVSLD